jgi:transposase InsO family protein
MEVSRSGFYAWRYREPDERRKALQQEVRDIHDQKRGSYGSRRMAKELQRRGHSVGRYQARSLMQDADATCRQRRRWRHTTDSEHGLPVAPNLLKRQFTVPEPNQAWVADNHRHLDPGGLAEHGFRASMSRKGNCWDNAVMERFFGFLKSEWLDGQRYWTCQAARRDVVAYIEMEYNSCRLHSTLDYHAPREVGQVAAAA